MTRGACARVVRKQDHEGILTNRAHRHPDVTGHRAFKSDSDMLHPRVKRIVLCVYTVTEDRHRDF